MLRQARGDPQRPAAADALDDVHVQAELERPLGDRRDEVAGGRLGRAVVDELDALHEPVAAHVADALVAILQREQAVAEELAERAGALVHPLVDRARRARCCRRGDERVGDVGGEEQKAAVVGLLLDLGAGDHGGQRIAGAECLGEREDVRDDPVALERVPGAGAAQAGLGLVEDQQHPALLALRLQRGEVARRRDDHAAARSGSARRCRRPARRRTARRSARRPRSSWRRQSSVPSGKVTSGR